MYLNVREKGEAAIRDQRWQLTDNGAIVWDIGKETVPAHEDHLEMSGKQVSAIIRYGIDERGALTLGRTVIWPSLRTLPNNTHASLQHSYTGTKEPEIRINGVLVEAEYPYEFAFDGTLQVRSRTHCGMRIQRTLFPSTREKAYVERYCLENESAEDIRLAIGSITASETARGSKGIYLLQVRHDAPAQCLLSPGRNLTFSVIYSAKKLLEPQIACDGEAEQASRSAFMRRTSQTLRLETPDAILNQGFAFAKLRALESIFATQGGLMHCPGGGAYYAAVWTNDQAEYAGPFFPYTGDPDALEASLNCYRLYMPFMGPDYTRLPSSIIAEGIDIWEGAGDRGDAAMYAYGASLFALSQGDRNIAEELWPAIMWCLEYCRRNKTDVGVIRSDSDELEGRFPAGAANLSTSSLAYGAYRNTAHMARALGRNKEAAELDEQATQLASAIELHFGAQVEGFETYRYFEGCEPLRSWICVPLTVGLMQRKDATIEAMYSPKLWTEDGLVVESGKPTFWDRSTLYGLRAGFMAGAKESTLTKLQHYSQRRLLGEHVPYPMEAYPEGNGRHLSAESALYCRVFIEGLFGLQPTGLAQFSCRPQLPEAWDRMALRSVKAFGRCFDLEVIRVGDQQALHVICDGQTKSYVSDSSEAFEISFA